MTSTLASGPDESQSSKLTYDSRLRHAEVATKSRNVNQEFTSLRQFYVKIPQFIAK